MFSTSKVEVHSFFLWFRRVFIIVLINDNLRVLRRQWTHHHQHCNNSDDGAEQGRPPSVIVILVNQANKEFGAFFGPKKEQNRRGKECETSLVVFLESIWSGLRPKLVFRNPFRNPKALPCGWGVGSHKTSVGTATNFLPSLREFFSGRRKAPSEWA
jgi:hypothetical protein